MPPANFILFCLQTIYYILEKLIGLLYSRANFHLQDTEMKLEMLCYCFTQCLPMISWFVTSCKVTACFCWELQYYSWLETSFPALHWTGHSSIRRKIHRSINFECSASLLYDDVSKLMSTHQTSHASSSKRSHSSVQISAWQWDSLHNAMRVRIEEDLHMFDGRKSCFRL